MGRVSFDPDVELIRYFESIIKVLVSISAIFDACGAPSRLLSIKEIDDFEKFSEVTNILFEPSLTTGCFSGSLDIGQSFEGTGDDDALVFTPCRFFGLSYSFCHRAKVDVIRSSAEVTTRLWLKELLSFEVFSTDLDEDDFNRFARDARDRYTYSWIARVLLQNDTDGFQPQMTLFKQIP
jgi:hypothetical protein